MRPANLSVRVVPVTICWFRRDLRLGDHPALLQAAADGAEVLPLFVLDDALRGPAGAPRLTFLYRSLRDLDAATGGRLVVRTGQPAEVVRELAGEVGARSVHVSADFGPYGRARDDRVAAALAADGRELVATGSPYAVAPGRVRKPDGTPYRVFTPYLRAWLAHGWRAPAAGPPVVWAQGVAGEGVPADPGLGDTVLPPAGEAAALARWQEFRDEHLAGYVERRNRPDVAGTSQLSVYVKYGAVHPRTLLADLAQAGHGAGHGTGQGAGQGAGPTSFRTELAWREFYADVLFTAPTSAHEPLRPDTGAIRVDDGADADRRFAAWAAGRTGFPIVDAGMRQLRAEAWVHNRVRMIVASFLVKDLHVPWQRGSRYFMTHLRDGDLASNSHGWQWVAGTGTDAAPYFRVFNPVSQGRTFDPDGDYVRRHVPELRDVGGAEVHEPWTWPGGQPPGYPERIVDHAAERREALARYAEVAG
jgi:deoxyribodipyrimidine photo-lyase